MNKLLLSLFFFITITHIIAQDISYVNAENGLIIREAPNPKSKKIGKLLYGTAVKVVKNTKITLEIIDDNEKVSGSWVLIKEVDGTQNGYVFSGFLVKDGIFSLIEPNVTQLKELHKSDQKTEVIYHYLASNYKKSGEKYNVKHYDWNQSEICSFAEDFKPGITFELFECKEAGGSTIKVKLPKVNRKNLMKWIEKIYEVNKMEVDQNVWKDNNSKFEPKEAAAGCYYKIKETESNTIVDLYCGC